MQAKRLGFAPLALMVAIMLAATTVITVSFTEEAAAITTNQGWADSYEVNGKCYCASTFDHGIGNVKYEGQTVRQICNKLGAGPKSGRTFYNTVQCGHEPAHRDAITINGRKVQDEVVCPGRVGRGVECNSEKGPKWDLGNDPKPKPTTTVAPRTTTTQRPATTQRPTTAPPRPTTTKPTGDPGGECQATGPTLGTAKKAYAEKCRAPRADCDPMPNAGWLCSSKRIDGTPVTTTPAPPTTARPTTTTQRPTVPSTTAGPTTTGPPNPNGLVLDIIDAGSDTVAGSLAGNGRSFTRGELPSGPIGFDLTTVPAGTRSVVFTISGAMTSRQVENYAPYAAFGNSGPNFFGRNFGPGSYQIRVEVYGGRQGSGATLADETLSFEIRN